MPKIDKSFRFNPQTYANFKELAAKNGYTATGALEKFMADAVKFGLAFPSGKNAAVEAEARVMLAWLKEGKYGVNLAAKKKQAQEDAYSSPPKIEDTQLREDIEETLKKMP